MKVPILVLVVGMAATAAFVSSARESTITPRHAQASAVRNVAGTTSVYDDVIGPETGAELIDGDNSSILALGSEASTPNSRSNDAADPAEAARHTVPDLANVPDCAGGICMIYGIGPVASDSSDRLDVIASIPISGGSKSFDLMGTKDKLAASRTTAAFNAGADDFNLNSSGGPGSGDPSGAPDTFAYWQMH
jgi:hypothetical protein